MTSRLGVPLMPQESLSPPGYAACTGRGISQKYRPSGTLEAKLPVMHSGLSSMCHTGGLHGGWSLSGATEV